MALTILPVQAHHAASASPFPKPAKMKKTTITGQGGCKLNVRYVIRWQTPAMKAMPRCPNLWWTLLFNAAAKLYPTTGDKKIRDTTVYVRS